MAKGNICIKVKLNMLESMKTVISQVMESCTVVMEQSLMKDYGKMVCLMEKDFLMILMAK